MIYVNFQGNIVAPLFVQKIEDVTHALLEKNIVDVWLKLITQPIQSKKENVQTVKICLLSVLSMVSQSFLYNIFY